MIHVQLLGRFNILTPAGEAVLPATKSRLLAAYLFWRRGRWIRRDLICDMLWEDSDNKRARANLRTALFHIRKSLNYKGHGLSILETRHDDLRITLGPECWVDLPLFEDKARAGLNRVHEVESLVTAASLYQGEFLHGLDADWIADERHRLDNLHSEVLGTLVERLAVSGMYRAAANYAQRWLVCDHLNEAAHRALMKIYHAMGMPSKVVEQFERCRQDLKTELNVAPGQDTVTLYRELGYSSHDSPKKSMKKGAAAITIRLRGRNTGEGGFSENPLRNARLLLLKGEGKLRQGLVDHGLALAEKALAVYRRSGDQEGEAWARLALGEALMFEPPVSQAVMALKYIEPALAYYRASGCASKHQLALWLAAEASWQGGLHDQAGSLATQGLELTSITGDRTIETRLYVVLGKACRDICKYEQAREALERAASAIPCLPSSADALSILLQRGVLSLVLGELQEAEKWLHEAYTVASLAPAVSERIKREKAVARVLMMIVYFYRGKAKAVATLPLIGDESIQLPEPLPFILALLYPEGADHKEIFAAISGWLRARHRDLPAQVLIPAVQVMVEQMLDSGFDREAARWAAAGMRAARSRGWPNCVALLQCYRVAALARQGRLGAAQACRRQVREEAGATNLWLSPWLARADGLLALANSDRKAAKKHLTRSKRLFQSMGDRYNAKKLLI